METSITPGVLSDWTLDVAKYVDGNTPDTFVPVRGITELTPPVIEKNLEDDGDYDGGVWSSQTATGLSHKVEGTVKTPRGGMPADPGQKILEEAGLGVSEQGYIHFRCYNKITGEGYEGVADSTFTRNGGPKTDLTTAAFTLTGRGGLIPYTNGATNDATASAVLDAGAVVGAIVIKGGTGYDKAPTVAVTGAGTGATAKATVKGGAVVDINITTPGTGYTNAGFAFSRV